MAVFHGVARVMVKDYAKDRNAELRLQMPLKPATPNDGKWMKQLAMDNANMGLPNPIVLGPSKDGPVH